jgi:hypothetical protein
MNSSPMLTNSHFQKQSTDEQGLYDYLLRMVQNEAPAQALDEFRSLFFEGRGCRNYEVFMGLERLVKAKGSDRNFDYIFNRCCHILINHWQMNPQTQREIPKLVDLFDNVRAGSHYAGQSRVRQLVQGFTQSEQYNKLKRIATVISDKQSGSTQSTSVGTLINRYPYLYDHCLMGDDSSQEHRQTVRRIKAQNERRFELNLSRYVTYKVRLAQTARSGLILPDPEIIRTVKNPTLLSDKELNKSLKHFVGPVESGQSYKALSQSFNNHIVHTQTFGSFKDDLYDYILNSLEGKYRQGQFNKKLFQLFQNTYPECNHQAPSEFLMMRTSSQLLNFLIVEGPQQLDHYVFIDLITNLGVTKTVGLLLKIILFCKKVKPYLEKRFSILFNHYESFSREGVPWLVKSLENMQLAFSIHFGRVDLSGLQQSKAMG